MEVLDAPMPSQAEAELAQDDAQTPPEPAAAETTATPTPASSPIHSKLLPVERIPLPDLDTFAAKHSKYPHCIVTVYQIIRDLYIKQEMVELQLVDASKWGKTEYFIEGRTRADGRKRLLAPFYLDAEIDLPWLTKLSLACQDCQEELFLCIHTPETIM